MAAQGIVPATDQGVDRHAATRRAQTTDEAHVVYPLITSMAPKQFVAPRYYARPSLLSSTSRRPLPRCNRDVISRPVRSVRADFETIQEGVTGEAHAAEDVVSR